MPESSQASGLDRIYKQSGVDDGKKSGKISQDEMDKVNVDLAAAGVAFKERYNMPVVADLVEREQPAHLRDWFRERLIAHRLASVSLSRLPWEPKQK
ncbi:DNA polymerase III subunit theta [Serratia liquefaciens]|nr:DNA polymerase III subunit theta [Serratia liquefaciens]